MIINLNSSLYKHLIQAIKIERYIHLIFISVDGMLKQPV